MANNASRGNILDQLFDCVQSGVEWASEQLQSACPSRKGKPRKRCIEPKKEKIEEEIDIGPPCTERKPYILPSQICPKVISCCYIKMQDPYAPCCCETKPQLPPCPPKCHRRSREPTCGCDLCKKKNTNSKCCSSTMTFHDATDTKYFKRA